MTENFRLPTLRLGTEFDQPVIPLDLPATLERGSNRAMAILDGADRAPIRLSRMVRPVGLLGIKTSACSVPVRVRLSLLADELSSRMWDREQRRVTREEPKLDDAGQVIISDHRHQHRLVQVSAQGRPRALALLTWRPADGEFTRTTVEFEISAEDLGGSGLIMIDFGMPATQPDWAREGQLAGGVTGICVESIQLEAAGRPIPTHASTGRPKIAETQVIGRNPGYFVLNPGQGGAVRVRATPHWADDERLPGRRAKVKHPVRFAREWSADRRVSGLGGATVSVVDSAGTEVLRESMHRQGSAYSFELPAFEQPCYVQLHKRVGGGSPRLINWYLEVDPA